MTFMRRSDQGKEYDARSLNENMRDLDQASKRGVQWTRRKVQAIYTEPMWLGALAAAPDVILCGRVQAVNGPEIPVACGSLVHFVWDGSDKGARITSIDGLTPIPGVQYRFTFLIAAGDV